MISLKILNFGWLWSQICLLIPGLCTTSDVTATNMNCALVSWVCDYRLCRCGILERRDSVLSLLPVCFNSSTPMLVLMPGIFLNGDARNSGEDCIGDITVGPNGVMVMNKTSLYKLHMTKFHHSVSPQLSQLLRFRYGFVFWSSCPWSYCLFLFNSNFHRHWFTSECHHLLQRNKNKLDFLTLLLDLAESSHHPQWSKGLPSIQSRPVRLCDTVQSASLCRFIYFGTVFKFLLCTCAHILVYVVGLCQWFYYNIQQFLAAVYCICWSLFLITSYWKSCQKVKRHSEFKK